MSSHHSLSQKSKTLSKKNVQNELREFYKVAKENLLNLKNEVEILNQEVKLYQNTVKDLEEEIDKLKKANKELAKLWNDANRKLWCNNESARQLRELSKDILNSQKIDKNQIATYIYDISFYVGGGVGVELKSKDK